MMRRESWQNALPIRSFVIILVVVLTVLFGIHLSDMVRRAYQLNTEIARIRADTAALQAENQRLRQRLEYLHTDEAIELLARSRLGWRRPGETAIVIVPDGEVQVRAVTTPVTAQPEENWVRWIKYLTGSAK